MTYPDEDRLDRHIRLRKLVRALREGSPFQAHESVRDIYHLALDEKVSMVSAIAALKEALVRSDPELQDYAARILVVHYFKTGNFQKIEKLLEHIYVVRVGALRQLSEKRIHIINPPAALLLLVHALGGSRLPIPVAILHLATLLSHCNSLEGLDQMEKILLEKHAIVLALPLSRASPEQLRLRIAVASVAGMFSERKAVLAKAKDGELLAGDTISIPRRTGLYSTVRRGALHV